MRIFFFLSINRHSTTVNLPGIFLGASAHLKETFSSSPLRQFTEQGVNPSHHYLSWLGQAYPFSE
jgi:hypothetical protein